MPEDIEAKEGDNIFALKEELEKERERAEEHLAGWKRAQADLANYRRRTEEEREDFSRRANARLILRLLPILDDLQRAVAAIPPELEENDWVKGIKLISKKFWATLESEGLRPIEAEGKPFDPDVHEAVMCDHGKKDIVIKELEKGYYLFDKVLRYSKVIVGSGQEAADQEEV